MRLASASDNKLGCLMGRAMKSVKSYCFLNWTVGKIWEHEYSVFLRGRLRKIHHYCIAWPLHFKYPSYANVTHIVTQFLHNLTHIVTQFYITLHTLSHIFYTTLHTCHTIIFSMMSCDVTHIVTQSLHDVAQLYTHLSQSLHDVTWPYTHCHMFLTWCHTTLYT